MVSKLGALAGEESVARIAGPPIGRGLELRGSLRCVKMCP